MAFKKIQDVEIMAPVGSYETLQAAIKGGATSVYFGIGSLNMRSGSSVNFTITDLKKIVGICKKANVKTYLTLNTVMYGEDLEVMKKICDTAKKLDVSAIIACDFAVIEYARKINLEVHTSTQANVSNIEAVKFFSRYADVIVLARELTLEQIKDICSEIKKQKIKGPNGKLVQIEVFIHGALCVSISGKCYMSLATYNRSANRGACLQNCRRAYRVIDEETGDELVIDNKYVMSPSDLCTIGFLDKLIDAGVSVFKIEGRGRKADYVYKTVKIYNEAIQSIKNNSYTKEKIADWTKELESVYNRGFWHGGYYLGKKINEWSADHGSKATTEHVYIGKCLNYYPKAKVALFKLEAGELNIEDNVIVTGPTTGIVECKVNELVLVSNNKASHDKKSSNVKKGDVITMPIPEKIRKNDKLLLVKERKH